MWRVTYGGFTILETEDEDEAYEAYLGCGPYGKIMEDLHYE